MATEIRTFHAHGGRAWVAEILGRDQKYGFSRRFLPKRDVTRSGNVYRSISVAVPLSEGTIYEWREQSSARNPSGGFWIVRDSALADAEQKDVEDWLDGRQSEGAR